MTNEIELRVQLIPTRVPRPFNKEAIVFSTNCALGQLNSHMQKNEAKPYLTPYIEMNSKWKTSVKAKPIKLLKQG